MAFVNEIATKEDLEKYGIAELQKKNLVPDGWDDWTIDRERNLVLMRTGQGREEDANLIKFLLLRQGEAFFFWLIRDIDLEKKTLRWSVSRTKEPEYNSEEERSRWEAAFRGLKDALLTYKAVGVRASPDIHYASIEFTNF